MIHSQHIQSGSYHIWPIMKWSYVFICSNFTYCPCVESQGRSEVRTKVRSWSWSFDKSTRKRRRFCLPFFVHTWYIHDQLTEYVIRRFCVGTNNACPLMQTSSWGFFLCFSFKLSCLCLTKRKKKEFYLLVEGNLIDKLVEVVHIISNCLRGGDAFK